MLQDIEIFHRDAQKIVEIFDAFAERLLLVGEALADHICYKCGSKESFETIRAMFEDESTYLHQTIISGRRIAYIKMKRIIPSALGDISFLELSDQKPDGSQVEGFDHIEVYPTAYSYDEFIRKLEAREKIIKVVRPHHTTHDIDIGNGYIFRCTEGPLIEKIKSTEM